MLNQSFPDDIQKKAEQRGLDVTGALSRIGGNVQVFPRMLRSFLKEIQSVSGKLSTYLAEGKWVDAYVLMHTMKGSAGIMGATRLSSLCEQLEKELKKNETAAINPARVDELNKEAALVIANIEWILGELRALKTATQTISQEGINVDKVRDQLAQLAGLLKEWDMRATDIYSQIDALRLGEHIVELDDAMANLDFERALTHCQNLSNQLELWVVEG